MISITLPYPPSVNTYWRHVLIKRTVRVLISAQGRAYRKAVADAVMLARAAGKMQRHQETCRLSVRIEAQPPDRRVRDLDNLPKAVLDALTHAGIWVDDSQVDELSVIRLQPVHGGCIRVVVRMLEGVMAA